MAVTPYASPPMLVAMSSSRGAVLLELGDGVVDGVEQLGVVLGDGDGVLLAGGRGVNHVLVVIGARKHLLNNGAVAADGVSLSSLNCREAVGEVGEGDDLGVGEVLARVGPRR